MEVTSLSDAVARPRRIAIGEFDGVHLGHRAVIDGSDTVLTFEPHPLAVLHPEAAPKLLTSLAVKAELIAELGVQELVVIDFEREFAAQSPEEFVEHILVDRLSASHVSVGENFRFGRQASGDTALLQADDRFVTRVVPLVEADGEILSSSRIRALVAAGDVAGAGRLLGAPFRLRGEVVDGDHRGRTLGYPTANLVPADGLACPGHGVYACRVGERAAATSVGVRPTFATGRELLVEAFLLDFTGDLYGQTVTIEFLHRLRGERRFDSAEALIEQMHADVARTRELVGR